MSLDIEKMFVKQEKKDDNEVSDSEKATSKALMEILQMLKDTTEYGNDGTVIALYRNNKYMKPYIDEIVKNRKWKKRKFAKEMIEFGKAICKTIQFNSFSDVRDIDNPDIKKKRRRL